jgi:hypothetical protein
MPPPSNSRCGNLNRFANTGTVFDLSTSAVVSVLNDADFDVLDFGAR